MRNKILLWFLFLQGVLLVAFFFGGLLTPAANETFLGRGVELGNHDLVWPRANFDGYYYIKIARDGYQHLQQAFFPLYPNLISWLQKITGNFTWAALIISNVSFILFLKFFYLLLKEEKYPPRVINRTFWLIIVFPTSFYFLCAYTESLFLFLVILSFYLAKKGKYLWAGLAGALAANTRLVGIFLLPALFWEYYQQISRRSFFARINSARDQWRGSGFKIIAEWVKTRLPHLKNFLLLSLPILGLLSYMSFLHKSQGDWFYFIKVQPDFGAQRSVAKIVLLYQVFWRYLKMIATVDPHQWLYFSVWLEFIVSLLFLFILAWGWLKREKLKMPSSWLVFATLSYFLPPLTGTLSSMPRYVLVCFPAFVILAQFFSSRKRRLWVKVVLIFSVFLLLLCALLFTRGYWVA